MHNWDNVTVQFLIPLKSYPGLKILFSLSTKVSVGHPLRAPVCSLEDAKVDSF